MNTTNKEILQRIGFAGSALLTAGLLYFAPDSGADTISLAALAPKAALAADSDTPTATETPVPPSPTATGTATESGAQPRITATNTFTPNPDRPTQAPGEATFTPTPTPTSLPERVNDEILIEVKKDNQPVSGMFIGIQRQNPTLLLGTVTDENGEYDYVSFPEGVSSLNALVSQSQTESNQGEDPIVADSVHFDLQTLSPYHTVEITSGGTTQIEAALNVTFTGEALAASVIQDPLSKITGSATKDSLEIRDDIDSTGIRLSNLEGETSISLSPNVESTIQASAVKKAGTKISVFSADPNGIDIALKQPNGDTIVGTLSPDDLSSGNIVMNTSDVTKKADGSFDLPVGVDKDGDGTADETKTVALTSEVIQDPSTPTATPVASEEFTQQIFLPAISNN